MDRALESTEGQGATYAGPLNIVAHGLPEGVRLATSQVPGNAGVWPVQLIADSAARPGSGLITFQARAVDPAVTIEGGCQQVVPFINHSGGDAWRALRVNQFMMAVTEPAPIAIELVQPTSSVVRGGELFIR